MTKIYRIKLNGLKEILKEQKEVQIDMEKWSEVASKLFDEYAEELDKYEIEEMSIRNYEMTMVEYAIQAFNDFINDYNLFEKLPIDTQEKIVKIALENAEYGTYWGDVYGHVRRILKFIKS